MYVRIYKHRKTATQSGNGKKNWVLEVIPDPARACYIDPLMQWNASVDTTKQIILYFGDEDSAMRYAKDNNMTVISIQPDDTNIIVQRKSYLHNFQ